MAVAAFPLGRGAVRRVALIWFAGVARLCNLRISVNGTPLNRPSTLYVGNHVSYLDVPVLALLIDGSFVAKEDVRDWPLFGLCARLYRTVFIKRDARDALNQRADMARRLTDGESLVLFPEGTSSDGKQVLPFKTALFAVAGNGADGDGVKAPWVQPFSIAYTRYADGRPLDRGLQAHYAWYGDMTLFPHLLGVFGLKGALVEVTFHPPVTAGHFASRKELATHCRAQVAAGVARAHRSRVYAIPNENADLVQFRA